MKRIESTAVADFSLYNGGTIFRLTLNTQAARAWVDENLSLESWQWFGDDSIVIEGRFILDILAGIKAAGLTVV